MATTPNGLPYPVGTDKVVDGDDAIKALATFLDPLYGAWTAYTPTYNGLSIGNAVVNVRHKRVGTLVTVGGVITFGSTTVFGATFTVSLPFPAVGAWTSAMSAGTCLLLDVSASVSELAAVVPQSNTVVAFRRAVSPGSAVTGLIPWTWASGDSLGFTFAYEAAP
jgi:hypothetical protein